MLSFWVWSSYFSSTEWLLIPEKLSIYILHMCLFIVLKLCLFTWLVSVSWVGHPPPPHTHRLQASSEQYLFGFINFSNLELQLLTSDVHTFVHPQGHLWWQAVDHLGKTPALSDLHLVQETGLKTHTDWRLWYWDSSGDRPKDTYWLKTMMLRMREALTEVWGLWEKWAIILCEKRGGTDEKHRISLNAVIWEVWTQGQGSL